MEKGKGQSIAKPPQMFVECANGFHTSSESCRRTHSWTTIPSLSSSKSTFALHKISAALGRAGHYLEASQGLAVTKRVRKAQCYRENLKNKGVRKDFRTYSLTECE